MPEAAQPSRSGLLTRVRSYLSLTGVVVVLLVSDLIQRTFVAGAVRLFPGSRHRILGVWIQLMRAAVLNSLRWLGGARFDTVRGIPGRPGVLVLMNHQSLIDIPLVVGAFEEGYPRIVTRRRYTRGIPLISHMIRLYQYPTVDPQATVRGDIRALKAAAQDGETPLVIFPEGSRSKDGNLTPWRRNGLKLILRERSWDVYVAVVDGLWETRRFYDFTRGVPGIRAAMDCEGPFRSPEDRADQEAFIDEMERRMQALHTRLRERAHG